MKSKNEITTVRVLRQTLEELNKLKLTEGQPLDEVIQLLLAGKKDKLMRLKQEIQMLEQPLKRVSFSQRVNPANLNWCGVFDNVFSDNVEGVLGVV